VLPNFLVIGAPRSGTTWIDENLRAHPDVFVPAVKELHFFDRDYDKGMDYYEEQFAGWSGEKAIGEATPDYLHGAYCKRDIPGLIRQSMPDVRLIASLRNPVERAYSRYWNAKAKFDVNAGFSFEEKLKSKPEFIEEGYYVDQLERYYALFPGDRILVLLYDDLVADPRQFIRRVYEFLGVDPGFTTGFEGARINTAAGKKRLARSKALWYASRALSRLNMHGLSERVSRANSVAMPPMSPQTRSLLVNVYREKNIRLQALIDRDLEQWNR
jgi:hypothetical protein